MALNFEPPIVAVGLRTEIVLERHDLSIILFPQMFIWRNFVSNNSNVLTPSWSIQDSALVMIKSIQITIVCSNTWITINDKPLKNVQSFLYLGRVLTYNNKDILAMRHNLQKARAKWAMIRQLLARDNATPQISAIFYRAIVETVLLYGSETWAITRPMLNTLESFHKKCLRRLVGRQPRLDGNGDLYIPPFFGDTFSKTGSSPIETYIQNWQETVQWYIRSRKE